MLIFQMIQIPSINMRDMSNDGAPLGIPRDARPAEKISTARKNTIVVKPTADVMV